MTTQEVEKTINEEFNKFYSSKYPNAVPKNLVVLFEKALMVVPVIKFKLHTSKMKEMCGKLVKDLTTFEVGIMANVIMEAPFKDLYKNLDEAIKSHAEIENFVVDYNVMKTFKEKELAERKATLLSLSGASNGRGILAKA